MSDSADPALLPDSRPPFTVRVEPHGWTFPVSGSVTLLEAGLGAGIIFPSSCRNGTCRACMCRLLDGKITYRIEWPGLSADEKKDGWILPCVALAHSHLTVAVPLAGKAERRTAGPVPPAAL